MLPTLRKWSEEIGTATKLRVLKSELCTMIFDPAPDPNTVTEQQLVIHFN